MSGRLRDLFAGPFLELIAGLDRALEGGARALLAIALGLLVGWWVYVPLHELLHAAGCRLAGGSVTRLEIDPLYGGKLLEQVLPFVKAGGDYAGRLSGFDTGGSDWVYLITDLAPFALALIPGFWALRRAARSARPELFGFTLPFALAPLLSLSGDAYEIGSLLVVHLPPWHGARVLVGDDLGAKFAELAEISSPTLMAGASLAALVGVLWAFAWLALARNLASRLGEPELKAPPRSPKATSS